MPVNRGGKFIGTIFTVPFCRESLDFDNSRRKSSLEGLDFSLHNLFGLLSFESIIRLMSMSMTSDLSHQFSCWSSSPRISLLGSLVSLSILASVSLGYAPALTLAMVLKSAVAMEVPSSLTLHYLLVAALVLALELPSLSALLFSLVATLTSLLASLLPSSF